jgi:hypothetical protein
VAASGGTRRMRRVDRVPNPAEPREAMKTSLPLSHGLGNKFPWVHSVMGDPSR